MINFEAALKNGKQAIQIDAQDGAAEIRLITSGTELAEVVKLTCMKGRTFRVMVFEVGEEK